MTTANKKELIIGVAMLGVSATYMVMAYRLPGHEGIDAATVPFLLAALPVAAIALIVQSF